MSVMLSHNPSDIDELFSLERSTNVEALIPDKAIKSLTSFDAIKEHHDTLALKIMEIEECITFPEPLLFGDGEIIFYIDSSTQLKLEAEEMDHCCDSYLLDIANGEYDFYRFMGLQRGTLAIKRSQKPEIYQFYGVRNTEMSPTSWKQVKSWFEQALNTADILASHPGTNLS